MTPNRDALAALVSEVDRLRRMTFKERLQDMQLRKNLERRRQAHSSRQSTGGDENCILSVTK